MLCFQTPGKNRATIQVKKSFVDQFVQQVCGLCGDYDGIAADDIPVSTLPEALQEWPRRP